MKTGWSIREAARRAGVRHPSIRLALAKKTIPTLPDGTIDPDRFYSSEWWNNRQGVLRPNTKPKTQNAGNADISAKAIPEKANPDEDKAKKLERLKRIFGIEQIELLAQDKINFEKLLILERRESLRLDNEERKGKLIPADLVKEEWLKNAGAVRNRLLLLPGKLAARLVGIPDVQRVRQVLEDEIYETLRIISEMKHSDDA